MLFLIGRFVQPSLKTNQLSQCIAISPEGTAENQTCPNYLFSYFAAPGTTTCGVRFISEERNVRCNSRQGPEGRRLNVSPARKGWDIDRRGCDPDFLYVAPSKSAREAFSKESLMKFASAAKVHRKSGRAR